MTTNYDKWFSKLNTPNMKYSTDWNNKISNKWAFSIWFREFANRNVGGAEDICGLSEGWFDHMSAVVDMRMINNCQS